MVRQFQFRIYTENKNIIQIEMLLNSAFNSFNVYFPVSRFNGRSENGMVVEIIGGEEQIDHISQIAEKIRTLNNQSQVMVTKVPVDCLIIERQQVNNIYEISMFQYKKDGEAK